MNSVKFLIIFILPIVLTNEFSHFKFNENEEEVKKRLEYFQKFSETITDGKISFEYEKDKGIFCKAIQDIKKNEGVFKVPKEFVFSSCKL